MNICRVTGVEVYSRGWATVVNSDANKRKSCLKADQHSVVCVPAWDQNCDAVSGKQTQFPDLRSLWSFSSGQLMNRCGEKKTKSVPGRHVWLSSHGKEDEEQCGRSKEHFQFKIWLVSVREAAKVTEEEMHYRRSMTKKEKPKREASEGSGRLPLLWKSTKIGALSNRGKAEKDWRQKNGQSVWQWTNCKRANMAVEAIYLFAHHTTFEKTKGTGQL